MSNIVVPYELTNFTIGEKFRNFMELYEFYILLDNLSSLWIVVFVARSTLASLDQLRTWAVDKNTLACIMC